MSRCNANKLTDALMQY